MNNKISKNFEKLRKNLHSNSIKKLERIAGSQTLTERRIQRELPWSPIIAATIRYGYSIIGLYFERVKKKKDRKNVDLHERLKKNLIYVDHLQIFAEGKGYVKSNTNC